MTASRPHRLHARGYRTLLAGAVVAVLVAGCGSAPGGDSDADPADTTSSVGAFPATIETTHGEVTVPEQPQRIVALTVQAAGGMVALGVPPLLAYADSTDLSVSNPWLVDELDQNALDPSLYADGTPNAEAIAAAEPDLIVVGNWQVQDKADFDRLNQIAPTVGSVGTALNPDWDDVLLAVGAAVGKKAEAEQLIDELAAEFGAVGAQVPDISTKTYQWVNAGDGVFGFGNGAILELFGLIPAANQDNTQNGPTLAFENTDQLDADLLMVWAYASEARAELDVSQLFQNLPSVRNGTVVYADLALANAINSADPLSLRWLKDEVAPTVEALAEAS